MTKPWALGGLLLVGVGCGGASSSGVVPVKDGGIDTHDDLASPTDAAAPHDAATAPLPPNFGDVLLSANTYASSEGTSVYAFFDVIEPGTVDAGADPCTLTTIDACSVQVCTGTSSGGSTITQVSAGTLTITSNRTYSLVPGTALDYSTNDSMFAGWAPGDTVQISASGATAPAFGTSIVAPAVAKISAPALSTSGATFVRSAGLALAWTGGSGSTLTVGLFGSGGSLTCSYDATTGSATIPASALGMLPAGTGYDLSASTASDASRKNITIGDWGISVFAYANAQSPDGQLYDEAVTLQ